MNIIQQTPFFTQKLKNCDKSHL